MILSSLNDYYYRLVNEGKDVSQPGFAPQGVHAALEISEDGSLNAVIDLREAAPKGNKKVPAIRMLPSLGKARTSGIEPNFLWDGPAYVLGRDDKGKPQRSTQCREAFHALHRDILSPLDTEESRALLAFLERDHAQHQLVEDNWELLASAYIVFRFRRRYLHEVPEFKALWAARFDGGENETTGICLVTGEHTVIADLHPSIKGIWGGQSSGNALCSYNQSAFTSYGKTQNHNGPVGKSAAFAYTTVLNRLARDPEQSLRFGDSTVICWASRASQVENNLFGFIMNPGDGTITDGVSSQSRIELMRRLVSGRPLAEAWPELNPDVDLHILSLKPNVARLSVGFYLHGKAGTFVERVCEWFTRLAVARRFEEEPEFPSIRQLAFAVLGPHKKIDDVGRMSDDMLQTALRGGAYPAYLLPLCLQRLRSGDSFTSVRAGLLRALLIKNYTLDPDKEATVSLNPDHPSPAYQLGRLFALLAGVQRKAIGAAINAGIRECYYGSASATPALVFPLLLRNAQNHISKAKAYGYDKLIRDVLDKIDNAFPSHLDLAGQGLFALGFYHQRADGAVRQDDDRDDGAVEEKTV